MDIKITGQDNDVRIGEVNEVQKAKLLQKLSHVFENGGFAFISSIASVDKDGLKLDGSAIVLKMNPIKTVETVIGMLNLQPEEVVVLFNRVIDRLKTK